ncbi:MAG: exodeoxyribonuclease VII small subunit [Alistipes sp.]|jgi:exodeoxyribonuclease VII small subunit|nr:exodeoxyribonuclease VII small subunit [Alistipes sp.]MBQ5693261.1 exodeoxyribonuclease VII small subunit [Alistipes sp.]MBQ5855204.1 exodeoxyribonuclease VII small subunit [Alistipes sp.]
MSQMSNISYTEAMAEIEKILNSLQSADCDVELLAQKVKRASELISLCRTKLRKAEQEVEKLFE